MPSQLKTRKPLVVHVGPTSGVPVTDFGDQRPRSLPEAFFWKSNGDLAMLFDDQYGGVDDEAASRLAFLISHDQGKTWGEEGVMFENDGLLCNVGPGILRLHSGKIAMAYMRQNSFTDMKIILRYGDESLKNWSDPICVTDAPGYHCASGSRLIQLRTGRLVYATSWTAKESKWGHERKGMIYISQAWLSDDEGLTWRRGRDTVAVPGRVGAERGAMEPCIVQTQAGDLLMVMRTQLGFLYQSRSTDGGDTWSTAIPTPLQSPESCPFITRIPATGDLLVIWNDSPYDPDHPQFGLRVPLSVAISKDDGHTWSRSIPLESDPQCTYAMPVATFNDRWAIFGYYRARGVQWAGHLQCMVNRWRIDDLYHWINLAR
ncbi:MAG: exo-alpha-sialidase [Phycisphaerales bacterium]|nr:exo-alpha-sialidase [Phycisphaerales bacterium]